MASDNSKFNAINASADEVVATPNQLASDGPCFSNLIAIKADRAGAEAIKTPPCLTPN